MSEAGKALMAEINRKIDSILEEYGTTREEMWKDPRIGEIQCAIGRAVGHHHEEDFE